MEGSPFLIMVLLMTTRLFTKQKKIQWLSVFWWVVAFFFSVFGVDSLVQQLESSPFFKDKDIEIVRLALGA